MGVMRYIYCSEHKEIFAFDWTGFPFPDSLPPSLVERLRSILEAEAHSSRKHVGRHLSERFLDLLDAFVQRHSTCTLNVTNDQRDDAGWAVHPEMSGWTEFYEMDDTLAWAYWTQDVRERHQEETARLRERLKDADLQPETRASLQRSLEWYERRQEEMKQTVPTEQERRTVDLVELLRTTPLREQNHSLSD